MDLLMDRACALPRTEDLIAILHVGSLEFITELSEYAETSAPCLDIEIPFNRIPLKRPRKPRVELTSRPKRRSQSKKPRPEPRLDGVFRCLDSKCLETFDNGRSRYTHVVTHHWISQSCNLPECPDPDEIFKNRDQWEKHREQMYQQAQQTCHLCVGDPKIYRRHALSEYLKAIHQLKGAKQQNPYLPARLPLPKCIRRFRRLGDDHEDEGHDEIENGDWWQLWGGRDVPCSHRVIRVRFCDFWAIYQSSLLLSQQIFWGWYVYTNWDVERSPSRAQASNGICFFDIINLSTKLHMLSARPLDILGKIILL